MDTLEEFVIAPLVYLGYRAYKKKKKQKLKQLKKQIEAAKSATAEKIKGSN